MLAQMDFEMRKREVDAVVVLGDSTLGNPDLAYVVGGALARGGVYFKRAGHKPLLVTSNLDIGTARKWGTVKRIETFTQWGYEVLTKKYGRARAYPHLIETVLRKEGVTRKVVLCGRNDLATGLHLASQLRKMGVKIVGEQSPTILEIAREAKTDKEIQKIRNVGRKTGRVVDSIVESLRNMRRKRGHLKIGKKQATIGRVKQLISTRLAAEGLTAPEGTIFAMGAASADPHNSGNPVDVIKEGQPIVFDIFPQAEDGYWFDLTRTYIVGRADSKFRQLYETVYEAQAESLDSLKAGVTGETAMLRACAVIERDGYHTIRELFEGRVKTVKSGFNHSLGHGVGLTIGERPFLGLLSREPLRARGVVTVEPGVYLPSYGGVRIEDTVAITARGIENLANVDKEYELT
jgi:Xaa-Pro aminopeptidase